MKKKKRHLVKEGLCIIRVLHSRPGFRVTKRVFKEGLSLSPYWPESDTVDEKRGRERVYYLQYTAVQVAPERERGKKVYLPPPLPFLFLPPPNPNRPQPFFSQL